MIGTTNDNMVMPVSPMMGYGNGNAGFGGDWTMWLVLLILFCGWGGNGFGGGFGNNQLGYDFPWLLNSNNRTLDAVTTGFDNAAVVGQLNGIQGSITNGFSSMEVANCNRAMNQMQTSYENQIASMNQRFTDTLNQSNQMNALSASLQNCCCENRASIADLKYTVSNEGCADRNALNLATRDLLTSGTSNTQAILDGIRSINDKLCDQELQAERRENNNLRQQLAMSQLASSQNLQTQAILAGQERQANLVEQYVRPVPQPAYIVQNPNCCVGFNQGCGCGCGVA